MTSLRSNNRLYVNECQEKNRSLLIKEVRKIPSGLKFKNITAFAKYLAPKVSLHWVTLTRNESYKSILSDCYLGFALELKGVNVPRGAIDEIRRLELVVSNLTAENARLKIFLQNNAADKGSVGVEGSCDSFIQEFNVTCQALSKLLEYTKSIGIELVESGKVLDFNSSTSAGVEVILDSDVTRFFRKWLKR